MAMTIGVNKCRTIVGKQCRHRRTEQNDIRKEQTSTTVTPSETQRCPFEKAGFIKQQADNKYGNKGRRSVPDDIPHHRNIPHMHNARYQSQSAPSIALQPIPNPFGCQITKTMVRTKIAPASNIKPPDRATLPPCICKN
jgi:hypothetical protein